MLGVKALYAHVEGLDESKLSLVKRSKVLETNCSGTQCSLLFALRLALGDVSERGHGTYVNCSSSSFFFGRTGVPGVRGNFEPLDVLALFRALYPFRNSLSRE